MTTIELTVHDVTTRLPSVDTDVLVWVDGEAEGQLGAHLGPDDEGRLRWFDAQGWPLRGVARWAEMPRLALNV